MQSIYFPKTFFEAENTPEVSPFRPSGLLLPPLSFSFLLVLKKSEVRLQEHFSTLYSFFSLETVAFVCSSLVGGCFGGHPERWVCVWVLVVISTCKTETNIKITKQSDVKGARIALALRLSRDIYTEGLLFSFPTLIIS